jgi:GT2 family glycosyltransferase
VILAHNRERALGVVLERLARLPVQEVLVVDNGSTDGTAAVIERAGGSVRRLDAGGNVGVAGRNLAALEARGELLLMLDDDSYPLAGAIEALVEAFRRQPRLGVAGGLVRDVDSDGRRLREDELGTFDWFLRGGRRGELPADGVPSFFFPEGASMVRREAFLESGGYFAPYFFTVTEIDLATRMVGAGWDVRYLPAARFEHMKESSGRIGAQGMLRYAVRNQLWYFWLRYPARLAARRIPAYLAFDLILCAANGALSSWAGGIADAWRQRDVVRGARDPLGRSTVRRAELNRGRMHLSLLRGMLARRLRARVHRARRRCAAARSPAT